MSQKCLLSFSFFLYEICTPNTLIHSLVRSKYFIPHSATLTIFRTPTAAISQLVGSGEVQRETEKRIKR